MRRNFELKVVSYVLKHLQSLKKFHKELVEKALEVKASIDDERKSNSTIRKAGKAMSGAIASIVDGATESRAVRKAKKDPAGRQGLLTDTD